MTAHHLDITVSELRSIVREREHEAHNFLWSDGATTWSLDNLYDELAYANAEDELHLEAVDLSEQGQRAFIEGYCEAAPATYDAATDCELSPQPWCAPFSWDSGWLSDFYQRAVWAEFRPAEMGRICARNDYDELAEILAEEADNEDEGEPESRIFYQVGNVPNVGPHDELWESLEDAMNYMASRGYVYVDSAAYGPDGEDAYYFVHPSHAEEKDINTSRPGWENAADLLDELYGYGYEPCLLPVIRD